MEEKVVAEVKIEELVGRIVGLNGYLDPKDQEPFLEHFSQNLMENLEKIQKTM